MNDAMTTKKLTNPQLLALEFYARKRLGFRRGGADRKAGSAFRVDARLAEMGLLEDAGWHYGPLYRASLQGLRVWASTPTWNERCAALHARGAL